MINLNIHLESEKFYTTWRSIAEGLSENHFSVKQKLKAHKDALQVYLGVAFKKTLLSCSDDEMDRFYPIIKEGIVNFEANLSIREIIEQYVNYKTIGENLFLHHPSLAKLRQLWTLANPVSVLPKESNAGGVEVRLKEKLEIKRDVSLDTPMM